MSFKTWADGQDGKQQGDKTDGDKSKPTGVPAAPQPQPEQAPAQTAPGNDDRKAG
jgi:hypothetical protein